MLARVRIRLPWPLYLKPETWLQSLEFAPRGYESIRLVRMFRGDDELTLEPSPEQVTDEVELDGVNAVPANVLEFVFRKNDFDRPAGQQSTPPEAAIGIECANSVLRRLRTLTRFGQARPLQGPGTAYAVRYLNDSGEELPETPGLIRGRAGMIFRIEATCALVSESWNALADIPEDYEPPVYDVLLIDAAELLPHVGAAMVLVATAIEVCSATTLNAFVTATPGLVPPLMWKWLTERKPHDRQPSTAEELDELMLSLNGRSLKDKKELWDSFTRIRNARNKFAHEGVALDVVTKKPMDVATADMLIQQATRIIEWIEEALPSERRRPRLPPITLEIKRKGQPVRF